MKQYTPYCLNNVWCTIFNVSGVKPVLAYKDSGIGKHAYEKRSQSSYGDLIDMFLFFPNAKEIGLSDF